MATLAVILVTLDLVVLVAVMGLITAMYHSMST